MDDSDELIEEPALNKEKNSDIENNEEDASDSENELDAEKHKKSLNKLKDTDPHLYKYLQQNDKDLLNFDVSDDSDNEGDDKHVPDEDLEVSLLLLLLNEPCTNFFLINHFRWPVTRVTMKGTKEFLRRK